MNRIFIQLKRSFVVTKKNIKIYYLKGPVIIFGLLLPFFLFLAYIIGRSMSIRELLPGLISMTVFFTATSVGPSIMPWETRSRTLERLLCCPISVWAILLGDMISSFIFGLAISIIPLISTLISGIDILNFSVLLLGLILAAFCFSALSVLLSAYPPSDIPATAMMLSTLVKFPLIFISGVFVPIRQMPVWGKIIALFSINQSVFDAYDSTPFLFIRSPLESCGKSNLGKSIQQMWNGILSTNIDAHHVFRLVHGCSPTFIIDENQDLDQRRKKDDRIKNLMSVINSGYQRGVGVIRFRERSGQFGNMIAETFDTYGPKVIIATKGRIPRDTQSRCVEIMMQRAPRGSEYPDYAARWDEANPRTEVPYRIEKLEKIREMMAIFRLKYGAEIKKISGKSRWRDELDHTGAFASLRNRDLEIFKPLIILCLKYKPEWTDLVAKYIREFVEMRAKTEHSEETTAFKRSRCCLQ